MTTDGRSYVRVKRSNGKWQTVHLARYVMEQHLGRQLESWEHVDHIDEDKTNDALSNLQILSSKQNHAKFIKLRRPLGANVEYRTLTCDNCGRNFQREARVVKANIRRGRTKAFCNRSCSNTHANHIRYSNR